MPMIPRKQGAEGAETKTTPVMPQAKPQATQEQPAQQPQAQSAVATAAAPASVPAVQQGGAVANRPVAKKIRDAIEETFREKIPLEWNTLHRVQANQGNFLDLEAGKAAFGNDIIVQLMTYQPSWQISPGTDDKNDTQWVRYSNDGKTTTQGEDCAEYLAALKEAGYEKAKMNARYQMAFVIEETPGDPTGRMVGKIVQIDLSESSKKSFDQFRLESSFKESRGMITSEVAEAGRLRLRTSVKSAGNFSWTVVGFEHHIG